MQIIGNLGQDAEVGDYKGEVVVNFSVAHTDKYKDGRGGFIQKTTWVRCSWWTDKQAIVPYLVKGQMCWIEGIPEAKMWTGKDGEKACGLTMRVLGLQLVGGQKSDNQNESTRHSDNSNSGGYQPMTMNGSSVDDDSLPF